MRLKRAFHYHLLAISILFVILLSGAIGHFFIFEPTEVNGRSMEPTYFDEDEIFIEKISLLLSKPQRGDIVSLIDEDSDILLIKRIIGLPGEQIHIKNGRVFIRQTDGTEEELKEPYLKYGTITLPMTEKEYLYPVIPEDHYFVIGDNRMRSTDSRSYGPVHRNSIIGAVHPFPWTN